VTGEAAYRRFPLARPATAGLLGGALLALVIAAVPLSRLAHQSLNSSGGSVPFWVSAAYGAVGLVVAWRRPANPLGWIFLLGGVFSAVAEDASFYMVAGQVVSYRRSSGERRQQLKWLLTGALTGVAGLGLGILLSGAGLPGPVRSILAIVGLLALPVSMAVAVFRYRLFDIDRILSRTLAYAIVTGLLIGVYAGLVLLATRVLTVHTPVAVAAATLAAAALFAPVRRRVQRIVDRRFNRARYDADRTLAAFAARLQDAVDLDAVQGDLLTAVHRALEPAHASVWLPGAGP
jgi:hypothetical protein